VVVVFTALVARALLLPFVGVPAPRVNDEFGHLLTADTFSHYRLTNPTPACWEHFETFHVNIQPTYHSMYPVGQGLALAFGQMLFHEPWIGVYLSTSLMCGAIFWTLRSFFPTGWALLGGFLAVLRFALFSYWMNSYWGGSMAALGGALALGAVVRLCEADRAGLSRAWMSCVFAVGLLILANSRPYEGLAYSLPLLGYLGYKLLKSGLTRRQMVAMILPAFAIGAAGLTAMGVYNHATTGDATLMPYTLNHRTYWPLPFFVGEKENPGARVDDPAFVKFFQSTAKTYDYNKTKSLPGMAGIESARIIRNWFFYIGPALTLPVVVGFISSLKQPRLHVAVFAVAAISMALAVCIYNIAHYFAPATIVVYVLAAEGLRYIWDTAHLGERAFVIAVCITVALTSCMPKSVSNALYTRYDIVDGRKMVIRQLESRPGRYLVLVSYDLARHYPGAELVHNGAEFSSEKILWARSKGPGADAALCAEYGDRTFVSVTTDDAELSLQPLNMCGNRRSQ
jgi:hypothetical protein